MGRIGGNDQHFLAVFRQLYGNTATVCLRRRMVCIIMRNIFSVFLRILHNQQNKSPRNYFLVNSFFFCCKLVALCKVEATTRQRATSGFQPLIHLLFAECSAEQHQVPDFMSLVRPGRGYQPTTLRTGGEHSITKPSSLNLYIRKVPQKIKT